MNPAAEDPAHRLAEHLFRHESARMVAILTGIYGSRNLQLAEDVVQEALARALAAWPFGIPENPSAWLLRTAKNLAIDRLRREKNFHGKEAEIIADMESRIDGQAAPDEGSEVADDLLRMMFVCCHPGLPPEAQSAIALLETEQLHERLGNYHLLHAVLGELEFSRGNPGAAADHLRRAIDLTETVPERTLLAEQLNKCGSHQSSRGFV